MAEPRDVAEKIDELIEASEHAATAFMMGSSVDTHFANERQKRARADLEAAFRSPGLDRDGERMRGERPTHLLPDENAPRHSWKFVKHIAAKARAEALKEAADLAHTQALIANTSSHAHLLPAEHLADALRKLATEAASALPLAHEEKAGC